MQCGALVTKIIERRCVMLGLSTPQTAVLQIVDAVKLTKKRASTGLSVALADLGPRTARRTTQRPIEPPNMLETRAHNQARRSGFVMPIQAERGRDFASQPSSGCARCPRQRQIGHRGLLVNKSELLSIGRHSCVKANTLVRVIDCWKPPRLQRGHCRGILWLATELPVAAGAS